MERKLVCFELELEYLKLDPLIETAPPHRVVYYQEKRLGSFPREQEPVESGRCEGKTPIFPFSEIYWDLLLVLNSSFVSLTLGAIRAHRQFVVLCVDCRAGE